MNWRWLVGGSAGGGGRRSRGVTGTCQPARGVRRDTGSGTCCSGASRVLPGPRRHRARGLRRFHRFPSRCPRLLPDATGRETLQLKK